MEEQDTIGSLTKRETEVFQLILAGGTTRTIAEMLTLAPKTIEGCRSRINRRLGVRNTTGLLQLATNMRLRIATMVRSGEQPVADVPLDPAKLTSLSERQKVVYVLVALGNTTIEIADIVGISPKTVETHRMHINRKLGTKGPADIYRYTVARAEARLS